MHVRLFGLWLALMALAAAQTPTPSQVSAEEIKALLQDPNGDLSRIAKSAIGSNGGNQLFYFPTRDEPATPAMWGLKFESIDFKSADGTPLHGWFIPAKNKAAKGTVVFSHGNTGSIGYHLGFVTWLAEASYNVVMYDYRGFGKSGGSVDRRGMIDDVKAAFASYQAMARIFGGQLGASLVTDEFAPKDFVKKLSPVPLLVVHGLHDEVVPVTQGRQLYEAAGQPKTFFEVKTGRHGNALSRDGGAYRKKMIAWLDAVMKG